MTTSTSDPATLFQMWELQQELYIPQREDRYRLMTDLIRVRNAEAARPLRLLDLACGPGSAGRRLRAGFPDATIVAVDLDPVLLALGAAAWPAGSAQPRWVDADLREERWAELVEADGPFDAVVSTTALHWLRPAELARVLARAFGLLRPGGMLLNGDYVPDQPSTGLTDSLLADLERVRSERAQQAGALEWDAWWWAVEEAGGYGAELEERRRRLADSERAAEPGLADHLAALRQAGFAETGVVWRDLQEVLLVGTRPDGR
jgi:SAM-dependent methyltransferase